MTGWRCAAILGNAEAIETYWRLKTNVDSGLFEAVQLAGAAALRGPRGPLERMNETYARRRDLVVGALREIGVEVQAPKGTIYVWAPVPDGPHLDLVRRAGARGGGGDRLARARCTGRAARASSASRSRRPTSASPRRSSGCASICPEAALEALTLKSGAQGGVEATFVPGAGMVCCALRHRGEELLGQRHGLRAYAEQHKTMGIPLLYPWANRLGQTRFEVAGRRVDLELEGLPLSHDDAGLPIHGLLAGAEGWRVERHEASDVGGVLRASLDFGAQPPLLEAFPFPHTLAIEATLAGATLRIATTVSADRGSEVPVAFGFHPYLRLPGVRREEWSVEAPVSERLELDDRMLPTGRREPDRIAPGPLAQRTFDTAFLAPSGDRPFTLSGSGRSIGLSMGESYPFAQVYAPGDDEVVAFEPMAAPTNALLSGEALPLLAPGEQLTASFAVSVADL